MALVYNASNMNQHVKVFGQHFDISSGQVKMFTDTIARFLITERAHCGLVGLNDSFQDPDFRNTDDGRKKLAQAKAEGVNKRIAYLKKLIQNETVSLQQDLDIANMKIDARTLMSDGMVDHMKELTSYQDNNEDALEEKLKTIKELEDKLS